MIAFLLNIDELFNALHSKPKRDFTFLERLSKLENL
jgi:hypothetical protein